jgi:hypothetical protein
MKSRRQERREFAKGEKAPKRADAGEGIERQNEKTIGKTW